MEFDGGLAWTIIGVGSGVVALINQTIRNFRSDIDQRMDKFDAKFISIEERMFYLSSGKTLAEAIMLEKKKRMDEQEK